MDGKDDRADRWYVVPASRKVSTGADRSGPGFRTIAEAADEAERLAGERRGPTPGRANPGSRGRSWRMTPSGCWSSSPMARRSVRSPFGGCSGVGRRGPRERSSLSWARDWPGQRTGAAPLCTDSAPGDGIWPRRYWSCARDRRGTARRSTPTAWITGADAEQQPVEIELWGHSHRHGAGRIAVVGPKAPRWRVPKRGEIRCRRRGVRITWRPSRALEPHVRRHRIAAEGVVLAAGRPPDRIDPQATVLRAERRHQAWRRATSGAPFNASALPLAAAPECETDSGGRFTVRADVSIHTPAPARQGAAPSQ